MPAAARSRVNKVGPARRGRANWAMKNAADVIFVTSTAGFSRRSGVVDPEPGAERSICSFLRGFLRRALGKFGHSNHRESGDAIGVTVKSSPSDLIARRARRRSYRFRWDLP